MWHLEHIKYLFKNENAIRNIENAYSTSISGIQNIENVYLKAYMAAGLQKIVILNHKWLPDYRKCLFQSINGIRNIESDYFKAYNGIWNINNYYFKA